MSGTVADPIGITNPPIDELLERADSKYSLVLYSAKRARQINAYYAQLQEGLLEYVGPLVDSEVHEKPMSIALREINEGLLTSTPTPSQGWLSRRKPNGLCEPLAAVLVNCADAGGVASAGQWRKRAPVAAVGLVQVKAPSTLMLAAPLAGPNRLTGSGRPPSVAVTGITTLAAAGSLLVIVIGQ